MERVICWERVVSWAILELYAIGVCIGLTSAVESDYSATGTRFSEI